MAGVTDADIAALADDALPPRRRAQVEAAIAACPDLARKLAVQLRVRATIRAAVTQIEAPCDVRNPRGPRDP